MRVLVTGASGYLGRAIMQGASFKHPISLSRRNSDINCDLQTGVPVLNQYDMVIHAAGKAHVVPRTEGEKKQFFNVNVTGTRHLLQGLEKANLPHTFVFISTVAVYGVAIGAKIAETAPLAATDAYGQSKVKAEELVTGWCRSNGVHCVILRLPLIVGANPPGNLGSMIKAIKKGYYFNIAGGMAKRSGVLLDDLVKFMPSLYGHAGVFNLTDGADFSYKELGRMMAQQLGCKPPKNIPYAAARLLAAGGDMMGSVVPFNSYALKKMVSDLTFDTAKAKDLLHWNPRIVLRDFSLI